MQGLVINPVNSFSVVLPHGRIRGRINSCGTQKLDMPGLALDSMVSNRNESCRERDLSRALNTFSKKTQTLYQSLNSFEFLTGDIPCLFRTALVSDSDKLSAQATSDAIPANYMVDIDRLSSVQTNRSKTLVSDETTDLDEGAYTFTLTVGDTTCSLGISVDKSGLHPDTNKDVLRNLAQEIGKADDNIEAFVTETERKVYSTLSDNMSEKVAYLTIRNKNAGDSEPFSLTDDTGAIIDTLNINYIAGSGQASQYQLDSIPHTSTANTISVDNNHVTITLLDTTDGPVIIGIEQGLKPAQKKLTALISSYNEYAGWLGRNSRYVTPSVKTNLIKEIDLISRDLAAIGLQFNANGKLNITNEFGSVLQREIGTVRETLTGETGFFTKIEAGLSEILENGAQAYGLNQSQPFTYNRQGVIDTLFANFKGISEVGLYA